MRGEQKTQGGALAGCHSGEETNLGEATEVQPEEEEAQTIKAGHRKLTAHETARYRCFLPDLAGLAGLHRVRPMSDQVRYYHVLFYPSSQP